MIDNIAAQLPTPSINPVASTSPAPASNQGTAAPDAGNGATASFASTLQNRMQQATAGKASTQDTAPRSQPATAKTPDALLALHAEKPDSITNPVALAALAARENGENPAEAVLEAIAAKLAGKDKSTSDSASETPTTVPPDANAPAIVPTALNVVAHTAAPPITTPVADERKTTGDAASAATDMTTDKDTAAILAAASDKNASAPANPDKSKEGDFADLMKSSNVPVANVGAHANHAAVTTAPVAREVSAPVSSPQWSNEVGNQVSWMVSQRESRADLVLNPPQLGRIEVSITLNGDQATANFVSPNADVRDALQGSLPRLREILADAGVFLGQANIGAESFQQNGNGPEKGPNFYGESIASTSETLLGSSGRSVAQTPMGMMRGQGLIDLFA